MMHIEPSTRCTLTDLLKGKGKSSGLLCGCVSSGCEGGQGGLETVHRTGLCQDHCTPEEEDDGDEWLKGIVACSSVGSKRDHTHIKVVVDEKQHKKRFF